MSKDKTVSAYYDIHQIPVVTLHEAKWNLQQTIRTKQTRGVITLVGDAGVGKSQIVEQVAREEKCRVIDIRTSSFTLLSAGVPQRANPETGMFGIAVPDIMPRPDERAILFFDELNQGQPHALNMFFSLMEDRCLFGYKLPPETYIVAAYNPASSNYQVTRIEGLAAYNRRMMKMFIVSDASEFLSHAATENFHYQLKKPCHPLVQGFIRAKRALLYDAKARDNACQFPCPATWETISLTLHNLEAQQGLIKTDDRGSMIRLENRFAMSIGTMAASEFTAYMRDTTSLIDPAEVLTTFANNPELAAKVNRLINNSEGKIFEHIDNVVSALFENIPSPGTPAYEERLNLYSKNMLKWWTSLKMDSQQAVYQRYTEQIDKVPSQSSQRRTWIREFTRKWSRKNESGNFEHPEYWKMLDQIQKARAEAEKENGIT